METNKFQYLYLDDNDKKMRDGDVKLINNSPNIHVVTDYPNSWSNRSKQMLQDIDKYDGLILDWEFTNKSEKAKENCEQAQDVDYSAEAIAEHIRVNVVHNKIKDIPIIICSADRNNAFTKMRNRELTSQDLFDLSFVKDSLFTKNTFSSEKQLYDLAVTYKRLQSATQNTTEILNLKIEELKSIDIRFIDMLKTYLKEKTTHDFVQFMLREFIEKEGILIDKLTLSARLGVDINKSGDEWAKLEQVIIGQNIAYNGILGLGWQRFWSFKLTNWWNSIFPKSHLRTMSAGRRIELLNDYFKLNLVAAEKIKFCSSDEFWTICFGTKRPIDSINGFMIGEYPRYPWQDTQYVSAFAELEKTDKKHWRINVMDRDRYNKFKTIIKNPK